MIRLIIATVMGVAVAIGVTALVEKKLSNAANGTTTHASPYQYRSR